jgi:hypothetical protein
MERKCYFLLGEEVNNDMTTTKYDKFKETGSAQMHISRVGRYRA